MAKLQVKYDPTLQQSEIIARLENSSPEESGEYYEKNQTGLQQTSIYGIHCPIIAVNNVMVAYEDIISFTLDDTKHVPSVDMIIVDRNKLIQYFDTPGKDNELRVQILPPFDDAYKKINLTFLITGFNMGPDSQLYIKGKYKCPELTSSKFKSFGEVSIYNLVDQIASTSKLGFVTNVEDMDDKRFVYCPFQSFQTVLESQIAKSGSDTLIYDWWIDVWNYLNLADMFERYKAIDPEDDMKVWISNQMPDVSESIKPEPQLVKGELTNLFGTEDSQLYVYSYRINNKPGVDITYGTDKVYSVFFMDKNEYTDTYIGDGDVKKDIFNNFEYKGEVYGEFDYITSGMYREPFLQKMKTETVEVDINNPLLGLQRGNRINFACYYNDDNITYLKEGMEEAGLLNENVQTNVPIEEMSDDNETQDTFKLDKSVSGQYLIIGNRYTYSNRQWSQTCILTRPTDQKPKILKTEEKLNV